MKHAFMIAAVAAGIACAPLAAHALTFKKGQVLGSDRMKHIVMEVLMKKIVTATLLAVALFGVTACSSYPGWVPDWAQVGAEEKS